MYKTKLNNFTVDTKENKLIQNTKTGDIVLVTNRDTAMVIHKGNGGNNYAVGQIWEKTRNNYFFVDFTLLPENWILLPKDFSLTLSN